ncbi:MAG: polysaccharide pyruvyl transferase family protein [Actinobacteria bacterium]|nr:polysaccharide pyruvyl transferase family protein [Actinomycetota bacterium]
MKSADVIVCSFFTADDYYRDHALRLQANLESLGLGFDLREIEKKPGEDWADICRKKVGFIADVCLANPDKKVFWIDVDCEIYSLPDFVHYSTADIIGFQRGFSTPRSIGYENRTRFWEPCFWGINTTPQARRMIADAHALEQTATVRATDDYFFEEAWSANATNLTFQIIPSNCAVGRGRSSFDAKPAFFKFGSSGAVEEFKGKVAQHKGKKRKLSMRGKALFRAKRLEATLPPAMSRKLRQVADQAGITGLLTAHKHKAPNNKLVSAMNTAAKKGQTDQVSAALAEYESQFLATERERGNIRAAHSFLYYSSKPSTETLTMAWWDKPHPGNYGDWLAPFIVDHYTDKSITFQALTSRAPRNHLVTVGSVGRFVKSSSVVVGTGVSSFDYPLNSKAKYYSLRGPRTAQLLRDSGGPDVESFGDPAIVLRKIVPIQRGTTNGRIAFVRHFTHIQVPVTLLENMDEFNVLLSHPDEIRKFIETLNQYDSVVTSAMHVMITCHSYGIPCSMVSFTGFEGKVHGTGIKYGDYSLGAGLEPLDPISINPDLTKVDFASIMHDFRVSDVKVDEVEEALKAGVKHFKR